jgi:hypothetical protein
MKKAVLPIAGTPSHHETLAIAAATAMIRVTFSQRMGNGF